MILLDCNRTTHWTSIKHLEVLAISLNLIWSEDAYPHGIRTQKSGVRLHTARAIAVKPRSGLDIAKARSTD